MTSVLYISSSSYSGSTLLSFLLNAHPSIVTVGEMEGWRYDATSTFPCSCGASLADCPFFGRIAASFREAGLTFKPHDFGTRYELVRHPHLNRYLTAELPGTRSGVLEAFRDRVVALTPGFARRLAEQDRSNLVFIEAALAAAGARVFVDASKSPYRLRHLQRIGQLDIRALHLIRDPRGVVLSNLRKRTFGAALAIDLWLREQATIASIAARHFRLQRLYYEDLCEAPDRTLADLHRFVDLPPAPPPVDFRNLEHHILGNDMRLASSAAIVKDERWKRELSPADLETIAHACAEFCQRNPGHPVTEIIEHYDCARLPSPSPASPPAVTRSAAEAPRSV